MDPYSKINPNHKYINEELAEKINKHLISKDGLSVLDIGAGPQLYKTRFPEGVEYTSVDAWSPLKPDYVIDLEEEDLPFSENQFGIVMMLDFIEHVSKSRGEELIKQATIIASEGVYLLTPMPEIWTDNSENVENKELWSYGNDYDMHKSSWVQKDFIDMGFSPLTDIQGYGNYFIGYKHG